MMIYHLRRSISIVSILSDAARSPSVRLVGVSPGSLEHRVRLLLAIEYENIEMIELLLGYNVDTGEALLYAIDEEFVEGRVTISCPLIRSSICIIIFLTAVELLLQHEDLKQQLQQKNNNTDDDNSRVSQLRVFVYACERTPRLCALSNSDRFDQQTSSEREMTSMHLSLSCLFASRCSSPAGQHSATNPIRCLLWLRMNWRKRRRNSSSNSQTSLRK